MAYPRYTLKTRYADRIVIGITTLAPRDAAISDDFCA